MLRYIMHIYVYAVICEQPFLLFLIKKVGFKNKFWFSENVYYDKRFFRYDLFVIERRYAFVKNNDLSVVCMCYSRPILCIKRIGTSKLIGGKNLVIEQYYFRVLLSHMIQCGGDNKRKNT